MKRMRLSIVGEKNDIASNMNNLDEGEEFDIEDHSDLSPPKFPFYNFAFLVRFCFDSTSLLCVTFCVIATLVEFTI